MPPKHSTNNTKRKAGSDQAVLSPAPAPDWAALQDQLSAVQRSLRQAKVGRRRLRDELGKLRQQQAAIMGQLLSLCAELSAVRVERCGDRGSRQAGDDVVALASSSAVCRCPASQMS